MNVHALRRALEAAENLENALLEITHLPELEKMDNRALWIRKSLERQLGEVERSLIQEMQTAGKSLMIRSFQEAMNSGDKWMGQPMVKPCSVVSWGGAR